EIVVSCRVLLTCELLMNLDGLLRNLCFHGSRHLILVAELSWVLLSRYGGGLYDLLSLVHQAVIWYARKRGRFSTIGGICCKSIAVILWISVIGRWCCLGSILTHDWQQSGWVNRKETHGSQTLGIKARRPDETRTTADPINVQASPS